MKMEPKEFMEKYGDMEVQFFSYYKYTFTFTGKTPEGNTIIAYVGGTSDDIYRQEITPEPVKLRALDPMSVNVVDGEDKVVDELPYQGW
jgi:hypothetical protein